MKSCRKYRAFTLMELITAVAVFVIVISFSSVVFKASIGSYRTANALSEVSEKFGVICDLLDGEFDNFERCGRLEITNRGTTGRQIFANKYGITETADAKMDSIYYYTMGEFQSWYKPDAWANSARVYIGHSSESIDESGYISATEDYRLPLSECELVRDVKLFTPGLVVDPTEDWPADCVDESLAVVLENNSTVSVINDAYTGIDNTNDDAGRYLCNNIRDFSIEWTYGDYEQDPVNLTWDLKWERGATNGYIKTCDAGTGFPSALRFTMRLYDSKGVLRSGRIFSYIVRLER